MKKKAITLIEMIAVIVVLAIAIPTLSIMLVNASWSSARSEALADAAIYAQELVEDIKSEQFDENNSSPWSSTLGVDSAESSSDRTTFDDVDDFVGCTDISVTTPATGFSRWASIDYVELSGTTWQAAASPPTDYKRITVTVSRNGLVDNVSLVTIVANY